MLNNARGPRRCGERSRYNILITLDSARGAVTLISTKSVSTKSAFNYPRQKGHDQKDKEAGGDQFATGIHGWRKVKTISGSRASPTEDCEALSARTARVPLWAMRS